VRPWNSSPPGKWHALLTLRPPHPSHCQIASSLNFAVESSTVPFKTRISSTFTHVTLYEGRHFNITGVDWRKLSGGMGLLCALQCLLHCISRPGNFKSNSKHMTTHRTQLRRRTLRKRNAVKIKQNRVMKPEMECAGVQSRWAIPSRLLTHHS
jgi:hypothetical protein